MVYFDHVLRTRTSAKINWAAICPVAAAPFNFGEVDEPVIRRNRVTWTGIQEAPGIFPRIIRYFAAPPDVVSRSSRTPAAAFTILPRLI